MPNATRTVMISASLRASMVRVGAVSGSAKAQAIMTTLNVIAAASLPTSGDVEVDITTTLAGWARRVTGHNLWVIYTFDEDFIRPFAVIDFPP